MKVLSICQVIITKFGSAVLVLFALHLSQVFSACKAPEISDATVTPIDSAAIGFATLRLSNRIAQDPGLITFFLYPKNSADYSNSANAKFVGEVKVDSTKAFQVPAGSWKIAYQDRAKTLFQMIDDNSGGQEWLRSDFQKGGDYSLILTTDGNRTKWIPSYTTEPHMEGPL